ncbi:MAG: asparagine synthase (glutamine-hydrolyzing) [Elusimicrobia bacterium]|nr:asparagine synthase (glutamine-hydrolyzing) [Elusimicrobiota bacterium]
MCGICGIVYDEPGRVDPATLKRANDLIAHRGPDDEGFYEDDRAGLAMRRLAIIDLNTGHQPISNPDGTAWIVLNGEIYNFLELRPELERAGYPFKTKSDTEVIMALYEKMGPACVRKLRGMFAFAIWDKRRQRLFLARDRVGKKPLVYAAGPGTLAFSSELRCLFEWGVSKEIFPKAIDLYLSLQYIPSPWTIYRNIRKLPPAHTLIYEKGQARIERYWDLPLGSAPLTRDPREAQEMLREKFREAVRLRLISDVPLGAFLSGGIDSSLVVAVMSEASSRPVKTFSIGFEEENFSELPYAREVARAYGCDHREFVVKPEMAEVLPKLAWHYGEPYADSSALPSYYVARETRRHVTVALNGDGGDENFAGYIRYFAMKGARVWDQSPALLRRMLGLAAEWLPERNAPLSQLWRIKRFIRSVAPADLAGRYLEMVCYFSDFYKQGLYSPRMFRDLEIQGERELVWARDYLRSAMDRAGKEDFVNRLLYTDMVTYLPECLMVKMDIATMANSLEGRSPFLDHELMELSFRMPGHWKLRGLRGHKWILKQAFWDKLPPRIRSRGKMGFGIPVGAWFRGRLRDYWRGHVLSEKAVARGYFNREALQRIWEEHQSGRRDHGYRMWALLMLELWHQECLEKMSEKAPRDQAVHP